MSNIVTYLLKRLGKKVGNGQCAGMVSQAFADLGYKPRTLDKSNGWTDEYVWGDAVCGFTVIKGKVDGIIITQPIAGDVIQYRDVRFEGKKGSGTYTSTAPHHTSVIRCVNKKDISIIEQNSGGRQYVTEKNIVLSDLKKGRLIFYRPILAKKK